LVVLLVALIRAATAEAHGPDVRIQAWEDASPASIAKARDCLPAVLQALYVPAMNNATATAADVPAARLLVEQAVLFTFYQRLSTDWALCKALAQGIRMGAHLVANYADDWGTTPALFPRPSLLNATATCTAAIEALPTVSARHDVYELFRHRFTDGVVCLRRYTVHGRVPTALGVV
jgi:hypothetical protein